MSEVEVLNGPRVTLRAPTLDDAELLFERIASDPEVPRYMSWRPHPDVAETRRVITDVFNVGGETTWLIELRERWWPDRAVRVASAAATHRRLRLLPGPPMVAARHHVGGRAVAARQGTA